MDTLYITTYGKKLNIKQQKQLNGNGGGLYSVKVPIKGKIENKFDGTPYSCGCITAKL